jgi:hypothetical protein
MPRTRPPYRYALEQLYADQPAEFVCDTIPAVLAWVPSATTAVSRPPFAFDLEVAVKSRSSGRLLLDWNLAALASRDPLVEDRARRYREGRSPHREHVTEVAAYGLALVAISILLPGRRVVAWNRWSAPDILFDGTAGALRGVEVAGRTRGGLGALRIVCDGSKTSSGKRAALRDSPDIAEAYLSLWCSQPRVSMMVQVKP